MFKEFDENVAGNSGDRKFEKNVGNFVEMLQTFRKRASWRKFSANFWQILKES